MLEEKKNWCIWFRLDVAVKFKNNLLFTLISNRHIMDEHNAFLQYSNEFNLTAIISNNMILTKLRPLPTTFAFTQCAKGTVFHSLFICNKTGLQLLDVETV